ncbi:hypothetical protein BO70DRAFT_22941 [Aspergillus heteromorphus CBS 117.55]|uniref:Uncharacterized protein n=1 Tax=Aspergillus heteromorphus CBS 117.55 TaxID=1448321 RepID=A0A317X3N3_9EURO|nr:uncharacterized protein BO70DRAFT_22941 [Aspergillus heteromorphus CBS 117.55]PWY92955.1 hypothetical protein BO70DRAFT_22941 [Aspergillus heteromorphus CBS 117.55]
MAEPEDVEEDLFADLYDADEAATQTLSSLEAPKFADPAVSAAHAHPAQIPMQSVETGQAEAEPSSAYQYSYLGAQHNGTDNVGPGPAHQAATPGGDSEPQGTGIKEDG